MMFGEDDREAQGRLPRQAAHKNIIYILLAFILRL